VNFSQEGLPGSKKKPIHDYGIQSIKFVIRIFVIFWTSSTSV